MTQQADPAPTLALPFRLSVWCGIALALGLLVLAAAAVTPLTWQQQGLVTVCTVVLAVLADRRSDAYLVTLSLTLLSVFTTLRYGAWRVVTSWRFIHGHHVPGHVLDAFFVLLLLGAELYAFSNLFLGYLQTLWPLRRSPVPLPDDPSYWPAVDLLIPTLNEPLSVVKYTALAAINIDWPVDKLHVYVLDDGHREDFRSFCEEAGIGYLTRNDNRFAKAGNINHALGLTSSPFVAIFDSDHVPTRSFLQIAMGWFGRDARLGMLQTPHHLYSPDPFERNLRQFRVVPNEGELFYGVIQDGNDFWNATYFCGSCAVMRRSALDEIGGIAVETVTEDAHTSLRMQMRGWNTAYLNIPQAAGLATERLSAHIRQRIRWARGMVQVLRLENPLFARGLSAAQRLCYFNAMSHFLYALPRLIFLTAPLIYLLFGHTSLPGFWAAVAVYAVPHLVLSNVANSRVQGHYRHSFWNEIYETVLAPYIFLPTLLALLNPRLGRYSVTQKGGTVQDSFFDTRIATPFLALLLANLLGCLCGVLRLVAVPQIAVASPTLRAVLNLVAAPHNPTSRGVVWVNLLWALFNLTILSVATAVARENLQRRHTVRVSMTIPANVLLPDGTLLEGVTTDVSSGGVMLQATGRLTVAPGEAVRLLLPLPDGEASLPATVVGTAGNTLRAHFDSLTLAEEEALALVMYSRADTWLHWGETREADRPLVSLLRIARLAAQGLWDSLRSLTGPKPPRRLLQMLGLILLCLAAPATGYAARSGPVSPSPRMIRLHPSAPAPAFPATHRALAVALPPQASAVAATAATILRRHRPSLLLAGLFTLVVVAVCVGNAVLLRSLLRRRARLRLLGLL